MNVLLNSHNSHILFFPFPPSVLSFALWLALPTVTRQLLQFQASHAQMTMPRQEKRLFLPMPLLFRAEKTFPQFLQLASLHISLARTGPQDYLPRHLLVRGMGSPSVA